MTSPGDSGAKENDPCLAGGSMILSGQRYRRWCRWTSCWPPRSWPRSTRCRFHRKTLGLLEGPDRYAYQRPEQIMDALQIGEGQQGRRSRRWCGLVHLGAGAPRRTERQGIRRRRPVADDRRDSAPGQSRRIAATSKRCWAPRSTRGCWWRRSTRSWSWTRIKEELNQPVTPPKNLARSLKPNGRIGTAQRQEGWRRPGAGRWQVRVDAEKVLADAKGGGASSCGKR